MVEKMKLDAVTQYFRNSFPECEVKCGKDNRTKAWWFWVQARDGNELPEVLVAWEFFREFTVDRIPQQLTAWRLAETMMAGPGQSLCVTNEKVKAV